MFLSDDDRLFGSIALHTSHQQPSNLVTLLQGDSRGIQVPACVRHEKESAIMKGSLKVNALARLHLGADTALGLELVPVPIECRLLA